MELEGSLSAFSVPEILQFLGMGRMTGELTIHAGGRHLAIAIVLGKVVSARASQPIARVGQMLVNRGLVTAQALAQFLETQKLIDSERRLGEVLVARKAVSPEQLRDCLRTQMEEEIWGVFGVREGEFKFENRSKEALGPAAIELEIESLVMEGSRRQDEWDVILKSIPGDETVLTACLPPSAQGDGGGADPAAIHTTPVVERAAALRPEEWRLLAQVDGFTSVGAICDVSPLGKFETYRVLHGLLQARFIKVKGNFAADGIVAPDFQGASLDVAPRPAVRPASSTGRFGPLFSRPAKAADSAAAAPASSAPLTPAGALAGYVTAFIGACARTPEFGAGEPERAFLTSQWQQALARHREADLIRATGFGLDASAFEGYVAQARCLAPPLLPSHQASLEALREYLKTIYGLACQRLGEKTARQLAAAALGAAPPAPQHGEPFDLAAVVQDIQSAKAE